MIYVADTHNGRIQVFTPQGEFQQSIGSPGTWYGQFGDPTDVAVDTKGRMHIADSGNHRVQMLSETGEYLAQWELPMPQEVQFESPVALTLGPNGNLYVFRYW